MIKKLLILGVVALIIVGAWYLLSISTDKCTVTLKTGEQEEMSVREIRSIYAKDAYNWSSYSGCRITGEGKITGIDAGCEDFRNEMPYDVVYYTVKIGNGIKFLVTAEQMNGFAVGDKVSYSGVLTAGTGKLHVYVLGTEEETAMIRRS